jgi:CubicO group peptidase (beta-lactamase class C family)
MTGFLVLRRSVRGAIGFHQNKTGRIIALLRHVKTCDPFFFNAGPRVFQSCFLECLDLIRLHLYLNVHDQHNNRPAAYPDLLQRQSASQISKSLNLPRRSRNSQEMTRNRRTFLKQIGFGALGVNLLSFAPGCHSGRLQTGRQRLSRSTPEAEGVSSAAILSFLDALQTAKHEMHSFMLVRHGRVVAEGWWSPYAPELNHTMYSMSKSFTSTAVGLAVSEGRISVEDLVLPFFPKDRPRDVSEHLANLRVKHLLTMSTGHQKEPTSEMVASDNWPKVFLASPITHAPGTVFMYNSGATYMLSAIVQQVTGERIVDYLQPRLFNPLAIEGQTWETCPRGVNLGGWGLNIRTEGLAKFGQLYLQHGVWNGRRVLPASWVAEATSFKIQQPIPAKPSRPTETNDWLQGYGYQFWRCTHQAFRGDGAFGQYTIVMPEQDAVIAITSETNNMQGELDLVWEHLLPAMKETALPPDRDAYSRLEETLSSLKLAFPTGLVSSPLAGRISQRNFELDANALGLDQVMFEFQNKGFVVTFSNGQIKYPIEGGFEKWVLGETSLPGTPPRLDLVGPGKRGAKSKVAASGVWKDDRTFEITLRYYEMPHHDTVTCRFNRNQTEIAFVSSIAAMAATPKDKRPILHGKFG